MSRDPLLRLGDIVEACERLQSHIANLDFASFDQDAKTQDAAIRVFEIIGEAVKAPPEDWKETEPEIPWRKISGFRDVLAHTYFAVDTKVVWTAAAERAPQLLQACLRIQSRNR
jgi:uncharacterized protein with HEPN domain